jgi:uncharacterized protein (TIRG00374 family)
VTDGAGDDGDGAAAAAGPPGGTGPWSFERRFEEEQDRPIRWKGLVKRTVLIVFTGVVLYLVAPSLLAVFHSWPKLATLNPLWFIPAVLAEGAHFACTFALQRIALRTRAWFAVITAQLSGNAISLIVPGGAAAGAAVQFRMLGTAGMDATESVSGLTAFSFLGIGGLLALPVFVLPVVAFGAPVSSDLSHAAWIGAIGFVLFTAFGTVVMVFDAPLLWAGRVAQSVRNRVLRSRAVLEGLPGRLLEQRNLIRAVLGQQWWQATVLSVGRLVFDYLCLLFCVRAVGAHPRPSLILLAYAVAGVIGLLPITPGGIGIVEASLAGFLTLAGLDGALAVLATLAYRLASYWLPMAAGPIAYAAFRHRYGSHDRPTPELGPAPT